MVASPSEQAVRNRRFSYLEFKNGPIPAALYDLENDPWETINLADAPAYAERRKEMADLLATGWKAALPPKIK
jgi:arylsulfatase A-like enzyme